MEGISDTPLEKIIENLKKDAPSIFTEGKIDWEKLKATLGEDVNFINERYVLNWAGKSNAFKEIKTPTTKTLAPCKDESVDWDNTEHIFIEGENLDVLRTLQKSYHNRVKMIYIDPPYNTGNDSFVYPDKFSETIDEYQKRVGDKDEEGYLVNDSHFSTNSKENGQYHSNWLNMMYPRLHLAKNLLKEDGVIFVSIDDNEVNNLSLMMNEIFGEENFISYFKWNKTSTPPSLSKKVRHKYEFILCYEKQYNNDEFNGGESEGGDMPLLNEGNRIAEISIPKEKIIFNFEGSFNKGKYDRIELLEKIIIENGYSNIDVKLKGPFKWTQKNVLKEIEKNTTFIVKSKKIAVRYIKDGIRYKKPADIINKVECSVGTNEDGRKNIENLFGKNLMSFPKPVSLVTYLAKFKTRKNDIILDFFAGSGTTAHAVIALNAEDGGNRKCISVQLAEATDEKSEAFKEGYKNIADISKERIKRAAKKIKEDNPLFVGDLGMKVFKLQESNFKQWQQLTTTNADELAKQIELFVDPVSENAINENILYELLLKSGKDLNSSVVLKDKVYYINDNELVILLDEISKNIIDTVISKSPNKVLVLDKLFNGNDKLKTNTKLQMSDAGIEFKTI